MSEYSRARASFSASAHSEALKDGWWVEDLCMYGVPYMCALCMNNASYGQVFQRLIFTVGRWTLGVERLDDTTSPLDHAGRKKARAVSTEECKLPQYLACSLPSSFPSPRAPFSSSSIRTSAAQKQG